jgi:mannose/fructose-specific phosphotransferase system component IIA
MNIIPWIILLTHGKWGDEIIRSTESIIGNIKYVYSFSLFPDQSINDYETKIEQLLKNAPRSSIILTDLYGGTPFNIALSLSAKYDVYVVSGLDMAMLIAADEFRKIYTEDNLINRIITKSINNCKYANGI